MNLSATMEDLKKSYKSFEMYHPSNVNSDSTQEWID